MDVAVGNPPYGALQANASHLAILRDAGLSDAVSPKRLTRDIVFLAQNLRLLKPGGELAVILPEGLAVNHVYADLRAALLERHGLWRAMELPAFLFKGTEAKTVALFLRKGVASHSVLLESSDGRCVQVDAVNARNRLDAQFHFQSITTGIRLADLNPDIKRGALSHAESRKLGVPIFHTTDFKHFPTGHANLGRASSMTDRWIVTPGDILIPRVGSRCLAHAAIVIKGGAVFTDCVYRIRVAAEWREHLLHAFRSEQGVIFRLAVAHGTCAASLSKSDLLRFPLG
jgi:type I restriction enzyme M protein